VARGRNMVPFGTEVSEQTVKGTLFVLGAFDAFTAPDLEKVIEFAKKKNFKSIVIYPHNEKTLRTMGIETGLPFSKRLDLIGEVIDSVDSHVHIQIEPFEGKRQKYTPIDFALRFLEEKYEAPFFLYVDDKYANQFASFPVFEEWIRKIRLAIHTIYNLSLHPKLVEFQNRWEYVT
jgi:hypothetical protein